MTTAEVKSMIDEMGMSSAYYQWPIDMAPNPPYILFYYPRRDDFIADNKNYAKINELNIELYTDNKDFAKEAIVEAVLESHEIVYSKEETYIDTERMYEVLYHMEVI